MSKPRIMVKALAYKGAILTGVTVTGFSITGEHGYVYPVNPPQALARVYQGYGQLRAESSAPKGKGFGQVIGTCGGAQVADTRADALWLQVED